MLRVTYCVGKIPNIDDVQCGYDKIFISGRRTGEYLQILEVNLKTNKVKERHITGTLFFEERDILYVGDGLFYNTSSGIDYDTYDDEKDYSIVRVGDVGYRVELVNTKLEITDLLEYEKEIYDVQGKNIILGNLFIHNHDWCYTNPNDRTVRNLEDNSLVDIPYADKYYSSSEYCCYISGDKLVVLY